MNADSRSCSLATDSQYVELAVEVVTMLADATRVRIILVLRGGEMAVGALADAVGKSPAVFQHLAKMRLARMLSTRQDGTRVLYRFENEHARQLVADAIFQGEHALGGQPAHHGLDGANHERAPAGGESGIPAPARVRRRPWPPQPRAWA